MSDLKIRMGDFIVSNGNCGMVVKASNVSSETSPDRFVFAARFQNEPEKLQTYVYSSGDLWALSGADHGVVIKRGEEVIYGTKEG